MSRTAPLSPAPAAHDPSSAQRHRHGLLFGLGAYGLWGIIPIYFKFLTSVSAFDIVAHRVFWSVPFLLFLTFIAKGWGKIGAVLRDRRTLAILALSSLLIAINWVVYVYSVVSGHILASSFGYYLNPLANVLLGYFVLKERLAKMQWVAVAIAAAGISVLAAGALSHLWISLVLCASFATYGLLRKIVDADAMTGLTVETAILLPVAIVWLAIGFADGRPVFGTSRMDASLLVAAGIVSTTPLLFFTAAARRLRYSTLGMLQFLAPTLQFLVAVFLYGEAFTTAHAIAFGSIWVALILYVTALTKPTAPVAPE